MAGTIKLDGTQFLEKVNNEFKITNSELKLKSTGNTIVDSSGNAVVSESGGNVTLGNVRLPSSGGIKDSSGNNILTESGGTVTLNNGTIGSGVDFSGIANDSISGDKIDGGTATPATLSGSILNSTKLASSGTSIYKSNGSTAVISESGGAVTLNDVTLGSSVVFPAGQVIQVKQTLKTNFFSSTSKYSSWVDVTGLSVNITPSSSSNQILVVVHLNGAANANGMWIIGQVLRNSTAIGIGDSRGISARAGFGWKHMQTAGDNNSGIETGSTMVLDTPNTTSLITYKVQACNGNTTVNGTWTINGTVNSGDYYNSSSVSSITVMEITA